MEPVRKIIHQQDLHDDQDTSHYTVCVKNDRGRAHLSFVWSGYHDDPFKDPIGPDMTISPCDCDMYSEGESPWLEGVLNQYHQEHSGKIVMIKRPLERDLLALTWREITKKAGQRK